MVTTKKIQMSVLTIFVAAALLGSIVAVTGLGDNTAYAEKDRGEGEDDKDGKEKEKLNNGTQFLDQEGVTGQASSCGSETGDTTTSCNNVALTFNGQLGNNALGQQ